MKHTPITQPRAKSQILLSALQCVVGLIWFADGILMHHTFFWILGLVFMLLNVGSILYTLWVRKHFPDDDSEKSRTDREDIKTSTNGMLAFFGIITAAFLVALLLVHLLR